MNKSEQLYELIAEGRFITVSQAAKDLGISVVYAHDLLNGLIAKGRIKKQAKYRNV